MKTAAFNALLVEFDRRLGDLGVAPWHLPSHLEKAMLRGELLMMVQYYGPGHTWRKLQFTVATEKGLNELFGVDST